MVFRILIVEDEAVEAMDIKTTVESFGYSVPCVVGSGEEAVNKSLELMPDLVLMDITLKGEINGIEAAEKIKKLNIPFIFITAYLEDESSKKALITEPYGYLLKPYDKKELKYLIELVLYKSKLDKELKISENKYRSIVETAHEGVAIGAPEGGFTFVNQRFCEMIGYNKDELIGHTALEFMDKDQEPMVRESWERSQKGDKFEVLCKFRKNDGSTLWTLANSSPLYDDLGNHIGNLAMHSDITEKIKIQQSLNQANENLELKVNERTKELAKSKSEFQVLIQNLESAVALIDANGQFTLVNPAFMKMFGLNDKMNILNVNSQDWSQWKVYGENGELLDVDEHPVRKTALTGKPVQGVIVMVQNPGDNKLTWMRISAEAILDKNGEINNIICTYIDITDLKNTENTLKESEKKFFKVFNNNPAAMTLSDEEGRWINVNDSFCKITGYSREELTGHTSLELNLINEKSREEILSDSTIKGHYPEKEIEIRTKSGENRTLIIKTELLKLGDEKRIIAFMYDITKRKEAKKALEESEAQLEQRVKDRTLELTESEQRYRSIIETTNEGVSIQSQDQKITFVNERISEMMGYSKKELIGRKFTDFLSEEQNFNLKKVIDELKEGNKFTLITKSHRKDCSNLWTLSKISPIYDTQGKYNGTLAMHSDITQQKEAEDELKQSEALNKAFIENAGLGIGYFDLQGKILMFNQKAAENLNDKAENLVGKTLFEIFDKETASINTERIKKAAYSDVPTSYEDCIPIPSGDTWFISTFSRIEDKTGNVCGVLIISDNISPLKKAEENNQLLANVLKSSDDAIISTNMEGIINSWNKGAETIYGYSADETLGKNINNLIVPDENEPEMLREKISNGIPIKHYETVRIKKDGKKIPVSITYSPILDTSGNLIGVSAITRDISKQKEAQKLIEKSLEEKEMLLKEIHHRVKNNLMVISSLLNLQSHYITDKEDLEIFKESQNRAKSMALIHERLYRSTDLKKIDFGDYIHSLAMDLFHTYVTDSSHVNLNLNLENEMVDINTLVPLGLIVNELVTNSMKHAFPEGKKGEINIDFYKLEDEFTFKVSDDGVGFPKDIDFKNTDSLGLQLVNTLVDQIDGEIELDAEKGTKFTITFKETEMA